MFWHLQGRMLQNWSQKPLRFLLFLCSYSSVNVKSLKDTYENRSSNYSHSTLILFHVDVGAITQTQQRRLHGGHAVAPGNFSVHGAAAWFQPMSQLFSSPGPCGKKGPWVLLRRQQQLLAARILSLSSLLSADP